MARSETYVVCESVDPAKAEESDDPGAVIVRAICGGPKGAMVAASRAAKDASHVAFHALRVAFPHGARSPVCGDRLTTRREGDDYVAVAPTAEKDRGEMARRCREELTRLDAEAQKASAEHVALTEAWSISGEGSPGKTWYAKQLPEARYRDGCAHHAFEAARQLADVLGLIGVGEREFYVEKAK